MPSTKLVPLALLLLLSLTFSCRAQQNGAGNCPIQYEQGMLGIINNLRRLHGANQLTLDSGLSSYSARWASRLTQPGVPLSHQPDNYYGSDVVFRSGASPQAANAYYINQGPGVAFDFWKSRYFQYLHSYYGHEPPVDQAPNYNYFSQFIWRSTTSLGVGCAIGQSAYSGQYFYVVVLNFYPNGNEICQYKANVWPVTTDPLWGWLANGGANQPEDQCRNQNWIGQGDQTQVCSVCPVCPNATVTAG